jgi:IPT/TIG domain
MSKSEVYAGEQLFAAAVVGLLILLALRLRILGGRSRSVLTGADGRWSTSRFAALIWTAVVVFMLLTLIVVEWRVGASATDLKGKFDDMDGTYLALLGGPFAAFLLAKVAVQQKTTGPNASLQKSEGSPSIGDLVQNDAGRTDLVDLQYVLFNGIGALYVLALFIPHPGVGIPAVPGSLAILTGGSATTYLANKALSANAPQVSAMAPTTVTAGETVQVIGSNLKTPGADSSQILVDGVAAKVLADSTSEQIKFKTPSASQLPTAGDGHLVVVVTAAGLRATPSDRLKITGSSADLQVKHEGILWPGSSSIPSSGRPKLGI